MTTPDEEKKKRPGDIHWKYLGVDRSSPLSSEELVRAFIGYDLDYKNEGRLTCRPAFEALAQIVRAYILRPEKPEPYTLVRVPWWVMEAIGNAWADYVEQEGRQPFDKCAGLKPGGQGKRPNLMTETTTREHRNYAADVVALLAEANDRAQDFSVEDAVFTVAEYYNVSDGIVWNAYKLFGKDARQLLQIAKSF